MDTVLPESEDDRPNWRKSAYSVSGGNCAEVASVTGFAMVRDTMDRDGTVLRYPASSWMSFLSTIRAGRFESNG